tara:strand:- start:659 stop:1408 length:750 start_codon:yes stop_codon:yes gene_type:complete
MESSNLMEGGSNEKLSFSGFFNHVFNFDHDNKSNMLNMIQYIIIALIPVVFILKTIKMYVPEEDETKGNVEITFEIVLQLFAIFFSIWFIDKIIRYIPTYSGMNYHKFNEINFVLPVLIIMVTMQTKLGAKINILAERFMDLWTGNQAAHVGNTNHGAVRVSQPIVTPGVHQVSRADTLDNMINPQAGQMPAQNNVSMIDALPNMMQQGQAQGGGLSNFQQQAIQNSFMEAMEPMAANGALGGSFGSSF